MGPIFFCPEGPGGSVPVPSGRISGAMQNEINALRGPGGPFIFIFLFWAPKLDERDKDIIGGRETDNDEMAKAKGPEWATQRSTVEWSY